MTHESEDFGISNYVNGYIQNQVIHIDHHAETLRIFGLSFVGQLLSLHVAGIVAAIGLLPTDLGSKLFGGSPNLYAFLLVTLTVGAISAFLVKIFVMLISYAKLKGYREQLKSVLYTANYENLDWTNGATRENGKYAEISAYLFFALTVCCLVAAIITFSFLVRVP